MRTYISINKWEEKTTYCATIKSTVDGNEEIVYFMPVTFAKIEPPKKNGIIITTKDFLSCYKGKDGIKPKLIVMGYEYPDYKNNTEETKPAELHPNTDDDDLLEEFPF